MAIAFRQLFPEPSVLSLEAIPTIVASLRDRARDRPYTVANFVSSVDGRATVGGRTARLSDQGDRALFHALREQVDAVIVGTRTLRIESYGRLIKDPAVRERRLDQGLAAEPLAVVVSRSGEVPYEIPLFSEPEALIVEFTGATSPRPVAAQRELAAVDAADLPLRSVMERLRGDFGVRTVLCEGGPTLFGALVAEGLVDELFLTLAPKLVGGESNLDILMGPPLADPPHLVLISALEREGSLFLRYALPT